MVPFPLCLETNSSIATVTIATLRNSIIILDFEMLGRPKSLKNMNYFLFSEWRFSSVNCAVFSLLTKQFDLKYTFLTPDSIHTHIQRYRPTSRLKKTKMSLSRAVAAPIMLLSVWTLQSIWRQFTR